MKKYAHNGFTMVEMVIVMVIIGILGGLAAPRLLDTAAAAKQTAADLAADNVKLDYNTMLGKNAETNPKSPWPTLLVLTGGTPGGFGNTAYSVGWDTAGAQVNSMPTYTKGGGATPNLSSCNPTTIAAFMAVPGITWTTRITTADYTYRSISLPVGSCEFINSPTIVHKSNSTRVIRGTPDVLGSIPLAADKSGVCVTPGWKLETFADAASMTPTSANSSLVKSIAMRPVEDQINCPVPPGG